MTNETLNDDYDIIIVGSGAAGLIASIVAQDKGLKPLLLEKAQSWGGTSALSGGGVWVPNNMLMQADGDEDSLEEALAYMEEVIEDVGAASSRERKLAFLTNAPKMMKFAADKGFQWVRARYYPDYYPDRIGGKIGRVVEGKVFDGKRLGKWLATQRSGKIDISLVFKTDDVYLFPLMKRTWKGFFRILKILGDTIWWRITGRKPLAIGQTLTGQLMMIAQQHHIPIVLNAALEDVIVKDDKVVGAVVNVNGETKRINAAKGVLLSAGGFARSAEFRKKHQGVTGEYSSASIDDTGDAIQIGMKLGAETALMDDAWWGPTVMMPNGSPMFIVSERSLPHSIIVDSQGERFTNESRSYIDAGHDQLNRDKIVSAIPAWLILDARHRSRYMFGMAMGGSTPKDWIDSGFFTKANSLEELATKIKIDVEGLQKTVKRFNGFADTGVDLDFKRGATVYDNYYSDPRVKPNPNLGHIAKAPFWAVAIYPGDLGTKGGLLTDEHARVVRKDGSLIEGLYATGNTTASVMGHTYPGPGSTLAPAMTFAYIAVSHMAAK